MGADRRALRSLEPCELPNTYLCICFINKCTGAEMDVFVFVCVQSCPADGLLSLTAHQCHLVVGTHGCEQ